MLICSILLITANCLADVVLSAARNSSIMKIDCPLSANETGRAGVVLCRPNVKTEARGHVDEQSSYSMVIQAAYGLAAVMILVVAYFIFRTMRFVEMLLPTYISFRSR